MGNSIQPVFGRIGTVCETGDLYAAKQLVRHASVRTTEQYLHPTADDLRARMLESDGEQRA